MAREGEGMLEEEERCPSCNKILTKEPVKKEGGGFKWALKCDSHGIIYHREPTYFEVSEFNA